MCGRRSVDRGCFELEGRFRSFEPRLIRRKSELQRCSEPRSTRRAGLQVQAVHRLERPEESKRRPSAAVAGCEEENPKERRLTPSIPSGATEVSRGDPQPRPLLHISGLIPERSPYERLGRKSRMKSGRVARAERLTQSSTTDRGEEAG